MIYYLPININRRRLHFLKLREGSQLQPTFSFVVHDYNSPTILSVDTICPQLISTAGSECNQDLNNKRFIIKRLENSIDGLPTYEVEIVDKKAAATIDENLILKSDGFMGSEDDYARVCVDSTRNRNDGVMRESEMVIVVSFCDSNKVTYHDSIKVCLYGDDKDLISCALDFGSEASQIRTQGVNANMHIISEFQKFGTYNANEYWQGVPGDPLYKSIFFINRKPGTTNYADEPKVGDARAFVRPLMAANAKPAEYEHLELLPNLKLVEIGARKIKWTGADIAFNEYSKIDVGPVPTLASSGMRDSILRLILSNFLHCILSKSFRVGQDKYLRLILLVPNVYYQSKIYQLITQLYEDYNIIQRSSRAYKHCKGIEIQVVSESDASFMGIKSNRQDIAINNKSYCLIIDAGKGTTDFSILQSTPDGRSQFNSLYRDGLPASGNVLTYAFYEALEAYMKQYSIDVVAYLRQAQTAEILMFANLVDRLKIDYNTQNNESFDEPNSTNIRSMTALNRYLLTQVSNGRALPKCKEFVDKKIATLVSCLQESLSNFMSENPKVKFQYVLLSGRGFLFEPFKTEVIDMLVQNEWAKSNDAVLRINGDSAKTLCLDGALAMEQECHVNCNSGLIGSPIIQGIGGPRKLQSLRFIKSLVRKQKPIDMDFFYEGSKSSRAKNLDVMIGGRKYQLGASERCVRSIFFVGEGFLIQNENSSKIIAEKTFDFSSEKIAALVPEALFPYNLIRFEQVTAAGGGQVTVKNAEPIKDYEDSDIGKNESMFDEKRIEIKL